MSAERAPLDIFHQEQDAIRVLLVSLIATLRREERLAEGELDALFDRARELLQLRWGKHSIAEIVLNGCEDDVSLLGDLLDPAEAPPRSGRGSTELVRGD